MTIITPTELAVDVIINAAEINDRHGVGILLQRIFKDRSQLISLRSMNLYDGEHPFSDRDYLLSSIGLSRSQIYTKIEQALSGTKVRRVLCIPYHVEEVFAALALHELFGSKICTYLMDDQNILATAIPDAAMKELLDKSDLCLAIAPEMRDIYTAKYGREIYFVPPVIPGALVNTDIPVIPPARTKVGAIFGNIWSPQWLELLRRMTRGAGVQLDWYGNTGADWNFNDRDRLAADGIIERGFLPTETEVASVLREYAYVVVPSGTLDDRDDNKPTSWLSLPSRIPFVLATANTPIVVLGNPSTTAGRFVERFGIGTVADYTPESFGAAVKDVTQPERQQELRENAARIAHEFVNEEMDDWIWQSLALGKPIDFRFEKLLTQPADYSAALATCLNIVRSQQSEIQDLRARSSPIAYFKQNSPQWQQLRRIWLILKGKLS
jgi:hypothetical protein